MTLLLLLRSHAGPRYVSAAIPFAAAAAIEASASAPALAATSLPAQFTSAFSAAGVAPLAPVPTFEAFFAASATLPHRMYGGIAAAASGRASAGATNGGTRGTIGTPDSAPGRGT